MNTSEKVAYLKGLAEGLGLGNESKEEKLIGAIIDTLECIARDIEELEEVDFDLGEELDAISDDLSALEEIIYDDDCCCGGHGEHGDHECGCGGHHDHDDFDDEHEHGDHECGCGGHGHGGHGGHGGGCCGGHGHKHGVIYEVTCPGCQHTITIDEEILNLGSIQCPSCGGTLEFDFEAPEDKESDD